VAFDGLNDAGLSISFLWPSCMERPAASPSRLTQMVCYPSITHNLPADIGLICSYTECKLSVSGSGFYDFSAFDAYC